MSMSALFAVTTYGNSGAQTEDFRSGLIIGVVLFALGIVSFWKFFKKAGHPGWASIIPIYNVYIMLKIAGRPGWWLLLYIIPVVNIVTHAVVAVDIAKAFGKSDMFGIIGLWLFSFFGFMILGFGEAKYSGVPKHA